jgi:hypothetical protein
MKTKGELLLDAFTEMRINGITVDPDDEDLKLALYRLEDFMSELNICINYNFEETPDINSSSGLQQYANYAIAASMAVRLSAPYGKLPQTFIQQASASMSRLLKRVCVVPRVAYPYRQPIGRGNEVTSNTHPFFTPDKKEVTETYYDNCDYFSQEFGYGSSCQS